jgi:hypothetical protein
MSTATSPTSALWLAYAADGQVVGSIRRVDDVHTVTIAGADAPVGTYPTMEIAKSALHSHLRPGSEWPRFGQH